MTGVNVTTRERVATPVRSIDGSERVTDLPRRDLPAPTASTCLSIHAGQVGATQTQGDASIWSGRTHDCGRGIRPPAPVPSLGRGWS